MNVFIIYKLKSLIFKIKKDKGKGVIFPNSKETSEFLPLFIFFFFITGRGLCARY